VVHAVTISALVALATAAFAGSARADAPFRVETRVAPGCTRLDHELDRRVERAIDETHPSEIRASVAIDAIAGGYRVTMTTSEPSSALRTTVIDTPTCEEAVDAAVVVLALAFGTREVEEPGGVPESLESDANTASVHEPEAGPAGSTAVRTNEPGAVVRPNVRNDASAWPTERRHAERVDRGEWLPTSGSGRAVSSTRVALGTGADVGTLSDPTLTISAALAHSVSALEVRAVARYGLPLADETVETGFAESTRTDFGAIELRGCHGAGQALRFSACAGTEVGAVRVSRRLMTGQATSTTEQSVLPRLSGTVSALLAHRGGIVEPELELAGAAVVLGREGTDSWLAVRVAAGAAVAF
jgi:hypothetical protein